MPPTGAGIFGCVKKLERLSPAWKEKEGLVFVNLPL